MNSLCDVIAALAGDVTACGRLVQETQAISFAVAVEILRDAATAEDAVRQASFRRLQRFRSLSKAVPTDALRPPENKNPGARPGS